MDACLLLPGVLKRQDGDVVELFSPSDKPQCASENGVCQVLGGFKPVLFQ